jgi:hypothetical protein
MTDIEFDLLDQLYFVQTFAELGRELQLPEQELTDLLISMVERGWVKVMDKQTDEEIVDMDIWIKNSSAFFYLATKKGLLAHNTL